MHVDVGVRPSTALDTIKLRVAGAAGTARRNPDDITIIAVSKMRTAEAIVPLLAGGHVDFGENRVVEAIEKWQALRERWHNPRLHLIGQLQSNKARQAVAHFDAIHSVDRLSLVEALGDAQASTNRRPAIFIQVNVGDEPQKGGCAVRDISQLLTAAREADLDVRGLMAIPPAGREPSPYFALLAKLAWESGLSGLSMGMSEDFETAVKLDATHVRIGSAIFAPTA